MNVIHRIHYTLIIYILQHILKEDANDDDECATRIVMNNNT